MINLDKTQLEIVQKILQKYLPNLEVWAFGSRVNGNATIYSDLDLAMIDPIDKNLAINLREAFDESNLKIKVDVVDFANSSDDFRANIKQKYIVLQKSNLLNINDEYIEFVQEIKQKVLYTSQKTCKIINNQLVGLYLEIGNSLLNAQGKWGENIVGKLEQNLKLEFPDLRGFGKRNLLYMKNFAQLINSSPNLQQAVAQIPWGHICLFLDKKLDTKQVEFYTQNTIQNNWSRSILTHQIESDLYFRQGNLPNNFDKTTANSQLVRSMLKDSYVFDFLDIGNEYSEHQLEKSLVSKVCDFLLELGNGFAFVGRQYKITVGDQDFFADLLFYNFILKRFVVIELKITEFKPEYVGQISFYTTAIDRQLKQKSDDKTIGILICKSKNNLVVEYALANFESPIGVSKYDILPSKTQITQLLNQNIIL